MWYYPAPTPTWISEFFRAGGSARGIGERRVYSPDTKCKKIQVQEDISCNRMEHPL